jgi:hypothetical protein
VVLQKGKKPERAVAGAAVVGTQEKEKEEVVEKGKKAFSFSTFSRPTIIREIVIAEKV